MPKAGHLADGYCQNQPHGTCDLGQFAQDIGFDTGTHRHRRAGHSPSYSQRTHRKRYLLARASIGIHVGIDKNSCETVTVIPMHTPIKAEHRFDLSVFDQMHHAAYSTTQADNQLNVVLAMPLHQIVEDEHQPRTDFNDDDWAHFVGDIKKHGVRNPIHIRPASISGTHQIINGARRYRASVEAGLETIPCLIQTDAIRFDQYAQILDNIKHQAMTAMDIALFIKKRLAAGDSKSQIAEQLCVNNNYITHHLALTEMSVIVKNAYLAGKVRGAQLIYRLNKLYDESPVLAENLISHHDEISHALILQARKSLATEADALPRQNQHQAEVKDAVSRVSNTHHGHQEDNDLVPASLVVAKELPYHNPDHEAPAKTPLTSPNRIKKPLLLAHDQNNQACVVLLHTRPTTAGLIWIKLEDTGEKLEVIATQIKLNLLTEAQGVE
ncbi:MAG: hypothetical protein CTY12_00970 [Methylotenera sp.]|nr:MAG: hypothetical protein CTY12_00970 [Methylotenera sp.]